MMKYKFIFSIIVLLSFLFGCNGGSVPVPIFIEVNIRYVDTDGNFLLKEPENETNETLTGRSPLEVLSVTDEKGNPVEFWVRTPPSVPYTMPRIDVDKSFNDATPKRVREYTVKYKVPSLLGDAIEEVRLIYNVDTHGYTHAWYNNREITVTATAGLGNSGDTIAINHSNSIDFILPVDTAK
ncbi:MAG: hypothetical protein LBV74_05385 [Tannerella sp.]|nr:hypothetical protein [Tannerella sp.]